MNFDSSDTRVGFWQKCIFTSLGNLAYYLDWGGVVYSPPNQPAPYTEDDWGSGHPPYLSTKYDAYCMHTTFVNEAHEIVPAIDTERYVDTLHYYDVYDWWVKDSSEWGHVVLFGGGLWLNRN